MKKLSVYLETSVIGCLTNRPSSDITLESHRQRTCRWWDERRTSYDLFISQIVVDEISKGDRVAVEERLAIVSGIPLLAIDQRIAATAGDLVRIHALPAKALQDAFHIAVAAHHEIDILLTWNCTHIANPHILKAVRSFLSGAQLPMPEVTTPEALFGVDDGKATAG